MTGLARVFDAAFPPQAAPPGCTGVLGYIGGRRATNVWTLAEWDRFSHLVQFPAYVPDLTSESGIGAAIQACGLARDLGWAPFQPERRVIVVDLETQVVRAWYASFAAEVEQQGFTAVAYGSLSTVLENAAAAVWAAGWDGRAVLLAGQTIHAHQYTASNSFDKTSIDFSVIDEWLFDRGGQGPRHA